MQKTLIMTAVSFCFLVGTSAMAAGTQNGCDIKKQNIEKQIEYAKAHGNTHQIRGLERALDSVNTYCTPESLYADSQKDVAEKTEKVKEREAELLEEKQKGNDNSKIKKRERKLEDAQEELKNAQAELEMYKNAL